MEISYRREMKHNYLLIEEEAGGDSYEARMLSSNTIEGLMKFRIKRVDNHCFYCYEITSKQPIGRLLESRGLKAEELRTLIFSMAKTLDKMEEYLLKEEQILLEPDYIYIEPDLFSVEFCLIPGRSVNFSEELGKLLEYLLSKVDYQDKNCVVMAYGLYRESLKDNYGMEDLLKILPEAEPKLGEEEEQKQEERQCKQDEWQRQREDETGKQEKRDRQQEKIPEQRFYRIRKSELPEKPQKLSWREQLKRLFLRYKTKDEKEKPAIRPCEGGAELPWQMVFTDERELEEQTCKAEVPPSGDRMPEWKSKEPEGPGTTLLVDKEEKCFRKLISQEEGISDICISYYPFLIGKQESLVDYVLPQSTVSRLHLRIDEEDGIYRIKDLNSTNGTEVAGKMLENNETAEVKPGDEVCVAGLHFRFM